MARVPKLFPIYGSALANTILATLGRKHVVGDFVASYVTDFDRREILGGAFRDRELAETIGREMVIAIIYEVQALLPRFFGKMPRKGPTAEQLQSMELFFREVTGTLERAWHWDAEDRRQFSRDLGLYDDFRARQNVPANSKRMAESKIRSPSRSQTRSQMEDPPFVDRVALLLDPSMLEQARRAARKFYGSVARLAQTLLSQTLHPPR